MKTLMLAFLALFPCRMIPQADHWIRASGTEGIEVVDIDISPVHPDTLYAIGERFLGSVDGGVSWNILPTAPVTDVGAIRVDPANSLRIYASHYGLGAFSNDISITEDGGESWERVFIGRLSPAPVVEVDPVDWNTVYVGVGPDLIFRSSDRGETWDLVPTEHMQGFDLLVIAPSDNSILLMAGTHEIRKSSDSGVSWEQVQIGVAMSAGARVAIHPLDPDIMYAGIVTEGQSQGGLFKSTDGGVTWIPSDAGLTDEDKDFRTVAVNPQRPNEVLAGTGADGNGMLFKTTDAGDSWLPFSEGLPSEGYVSSILFDTSGSMIHLGVSSPLTGAGGIYRRSDVTAAVVHDEQPGEGFALFQNYPNPFNNETTISCLLTAVGPVLLRVFDILGREVATLVNETLEPGTHTRTFSADGLGSGAYFSVLEVRGYRQSRRMIMIK